VKDYVVFAWTSKGDFWHIMSPVALVPPWGEYYPRICHHGILFFAVPLSLHLRKLPSFIAYDFSHLSWYSFRGTGQIPSETVALVAKKRPRRKIA